MKVQNKTIQTSMAAAVEEINWNSVVNNELPKLYNYFRYRLGDEGIAEDLTSVVLEKAWLKRHNYQKDRAAFSVWLFSIAKNEIIGYLRKRQVSLPISMAETASDETIEHSLEQSQDVQQLSRLLAGFSERDREMISLKFGADLNNREISTVTGLSESNVGTIISRVLQKLREQWKVQDE